MDDNNLSSVLLTVVLNSAVHWWVMEEFRHTNGNLLMQRKVCVWVLEDVCTMWNLHMEHRGVNIMVH